MPNPGDFDPAEAVDFDQDKAIRQQRAAEEARKQREEAEKQRRQAQEELRRANILKLLHYADKKLEGIRNPIVSEFVVTERWRSEVGFFRKRTVTRQRETRYYGSWLGLRCTYDHGRGARSGLVKLRQPRAGYAYVSIGGWNPRDVNDWDPRNVGNIVTGLTSKGSFRIFASLEEAIDGNNNISRLTTSVEELTKYVRQALNFVATGQPPNPETRPPPDY